MSLRESLPADETQFRHSKKGFPVVPRQIRSNAVCCIVIKFEEEAAEVEEEKERVFAKSFLRGVSAKVAATVTLGRCPISAGQAPAWWRCWHNFAAAYYSNSILAGRFSHSKLLRVL